MLEFSSEEQVRVVTPAFCLADTRYQARGQVLTKDQNNTAESKPVVEQTVGKTEAFCSVDTHYQELKSEDKSDVDKVKAFFLADTRYQAPDPKSRQFHEVSEEAFGKKDLFSQFFVQPSFSKPEACQPAAFCLADTRCQAPIRSQDHLCILCSAYVSTSLLLHQATCLCLNELLPQIVHMLVAVQCLFV